jgi:Rod binding domain-containing protein
MGPAGGVGPGGKATPAGGVAQPSPADLKRMREAARGFEAIFIQQMMKGMRQAGATGGLTGKGPGQQMYQDLADEELARSLSEKGGVGLADYLIRHLARPGAKNPSSPGQTVPINPRNSRETGGNGT